MSYHRLCGKNPLGAIMLALAISFVTPAFSATLPTDNEQEILVKTTLMTFNDANLTGNYSVLFDKSSKAFLSQISVEKLPDAFKVFRARNINLESIVADEIDSSKLKFVNEDGVWKILGLNVKYKGE
jgi:hypothetical protein